MIMHFKSLVSILTPCHTTCRYLRRQTLNFSIRTISGQGNSDKPYFVTTPIFYTNAAPHIGHLYSSLIADAAAKYQALKGNRILFSTGTDEHGLKVQQAAEGKQMSPQQFTDMVSGTFKTMFDSFSIGYTDYIRTTDERHRKVVAHVWEELDRRGYIYTDVYKGWYSVVDEAFYSNADVEDGFDAEGNVIKVSIETRQVVTWVEEDNYMFAMSKFRDQLLNWLSPTVIDQRLHRQLRHWMSNVTDLSVSRPTSRLTWGLPVPNDPEQTIYVWLDALVNYLTVSGYPENTTIWPPDLQIIGKDILKFHAVYWPSFLMALDLEPPRRIYSHSHWMVDGFKMSKSLKNVVDPMEMKEKFGADMLRYGLLSKGTPFADGNFHEDYINTVTEILGNGLGNLLNRCTSQKLNPDQIYPCIIDKTNLAKINAENVKQEDRLPLFVDKVTKCYENLDYNKACQHISSAINRTNKIWQGHQPWTLVKSKYAEDRDFFLTLLHMTLEDMRVIGILLLPIMPNTATSLLDRLGIPVEKRVLKHVLEPHATSEHIPLGPNTGILIDVRDIDGGKRDLDSGKSSSGKRKEESEGKTAVSGKKKKKKQSR